jgi:hypothetical protein
MSGTRLLPKEQSVNILKVKLISIIINIFRAFEGPSIDLS